MNLDNEEICIGERVYDVSAGRGAGIVTDIDSKLNRFEVRFISNGLRVKYDENGKQIGGDFKTLAWADPFLLVIPFKNESFQIEQMKIARSVRVMISQMMKRNLVQ